MKFQKVYDELFARAAEIVASGQEHIMMAITYRPTAEGYKPHGVGALTGDKDRIAAVLGAIVKGAPEMWLVVHITEAWSRFLQPGEEPDYSRPVSEQPGAYEVITFTFFCEGEIWTAMCKINRPGNTLEKGELTKHKVGSIEGRFVPQHTR